MHRKQGIDNIALPTQSTDAVSPQALVASEGFILSSREFRKTDRLLLVLTYDLGFRYGILARKRRPLMEDIEHPSPEIFTIGYVEKVGTPFILIKEISPAPSVPPSHPVSLANARHRATVSSFLARLTPDFSEGDILFTLAFYTLKRMRETDRYAEFLAYFLVKFISLLGSMPRMGTCFACGADLRAKESWFVFDTLRLLCPKCFAKDSEGSKVSVDRDAAHLGSDIVRILTFIADREPSVIGRLKITERQYVELTSFLIRLAERQLG